MLHSHTRCELSINPIHHEAKAVETAGAIKFMTCLGSTSLITPLTLA